MNLTRKSKAPQGRRTPKPSGCSSDCGRRASVLEQCGGPPPLSMGARTRNSCGSRKAGSMLFELCGLVIILLLLNLPLFSGSCAVEMIFLPARVAAGEWWRVFTYAFVHVSWYHLLLDGAAFLILYQGLVGRRAYGRMGCVLACGAGSLLASVWSAPIIQTQGLCGLSGIAHGLMAISALDLMKAPADKTLQRAGAATFIIVVAKSIVEAATGRIVFEGLHLGKLGTPVAVCHAGGVLGGLVFYFTSVLACNFRRLLAAERAIRTRMCSIRSDGGEGCFVGGGRAAPVPSAVNSLCSSYATHPPPQRAESRCLEWPFPNRPGCADA